MASLRDARVFGGIGAILSLVSGFVPSVGFVLAIIGLVLVLIAVKYISDIVEDPSIFKNMIISVVSGIIGVVVAAIFVVATVFTVLRGMRLHGVPPALGLRVFPNVMLTIIAALVIVWIFLLISAVFLRRSYTRIGETLNVDTFKTAALIYLIGAALTIVIVGFLIIFIAEIIEVVAFFSIPEQLSTSTPITT